MEVRLVLEKRVLFEDFEFPVVKGLEYLMDEENPKTDYLFINEPSEKFSMYFGAADYRLSYREETIQKYLDGSLSEIAELEEEVIGGMNLTWGTKDGFTCVMPNLS